MANWKKVKLEEICTVEWGNSELTKASYIPDGEYLAVSAAGCDGRIGHREHAKNTPVISAIGANCGRMFLPREDFTAIKNTITITPVDGVSDGRYLYEVLTFTELPKRGGAQPFMSKGDIESFKIGVPPLAEQRKIAEILRTWDEAIETAEAELKAKQDRKRGLMQKLFTPSAEGAKAGSISKSKGNYKPLGALVTKIEGGGTPSKEVPGYWNGDIPLLTIKDLPNAHLGLTVDQITTNGLESSSSKIVPAGIPVIATRMDVGRVVRCPVPVAINQDLRAIYPDKDMVDVDYIVQVLPTLEREFLRYSCGSTVMGIGIDDLKSVKIYLPPLAEQRKIAQVLQSEDAAIDSLKVKADLLRTQKCGLMQKLLTGEVRVAA